MSSSPLVTVLIPTYNAENTIDEALDSILHQAYTSLEVVIIDDFSTDSTIKKVQHYAKKHTELTIHIIEKKENKGPAHSRNIGINEAKGKYIALLDSDDYFAPEKIKKQVSFLELHPEYMGCATFLQCFGLQQNIVKSELNPEKLKDILLIGMPYLHASFMFRKDFIIQKQLFYNEDFRTAEDYEWSIRLFDAGAKIINIPEALYYYRISGNQESFTKDKNGVTQKNEKQWKVSKKLHYQLWSRFMPVGHPLYQENCVELFLRHCEIQDTKMLKVYQDWYKKLCIYNTEHNYFSPLFMKDNHDYIIQRFILGNTQFSPQLLLIYLKNMNNVVFPSFVAQLKFVIKCVIGFKYM
ncbi:glycosyltransferase [Elizabethkingia sp. JS20170427COW]|uniref:glycosyltransferase family 2 protein n=1 Tax=Elizabethkingia sp. JS20170427COW TaxID=2583851 RepID=UPI0011107CF3|nr:glycosyltransferase [Elizabethkingia sp. JS20170427COW]QCX53429.1 glycosyltransferase [Elizabethkingia sp. JS20170427COW]